MKKFTLVSQNSDTDSGRYSGGATSSDSSFRMQEGKEVLYIKIKIPVLSGRQLYISASNKALVYHVKQKLLEQFGDQLRDNANYGLFIPPANGRNGKFLEEDRPISAYITDETNNTLEFIYKERLNVPTALTPQPTEKTKNLPQTFLRYVQRGDTKKVEKILAKGFNPNFICPRSQGLSHP